MELFPVSEDKFSQILAEFDTNNIKIGESVAILEEWIRQQPHLPQILPYDHFLNKILANSKFRVESAKEKIEKLFTLKRRCRDLLGIFSGPDFVLPTQSSINVVPLPKLGPNNERIYVLRGVSHDPALFEFGHLVQITISVCELMLKYDRSNSLRAVIDAKTCHFAQVKKMNLFQFAKLATLLIQGYTCRIVAVDFINVQPAMQLLIVIIKKIMKAKIVQRLKIHKNLSSLHGSLAPEYLPIEYGGTAGNVTDIIETMDRVVEDNKTFLMDCQNYVTDEDRRNKIKSHNKPDYTVERNFSKLELD